MCIVLNAYVFLNLEAATNNKNNNKKDLLTCPLRDVLNAHD